MDDDADLLYGVKAIADFMHMEERQAYYLIETGDLPTFKIRGKVCARKSSLRQWVKDQETAAKRGAADRP